MTRLVTTLVITALLGFVSEAGAQPAQPEEPALEPTTQPTTQPTSAPVVPKPEPPSPPPPQPTPPPPPQTQRGRAGPGERCLQDSDCVRSLWCVEQLCRLAPPPERAAAQGEGGLAIAKGDMQLGGSLTITPTVESPEGRDSTSGAVLLINPTYGYFVSDGLELGFSLKAEVGIGELFEKKITTLFVGPTLRYIFNSTGPVLPYIGVFLGPNLLIPDSEYSDTLTFFDISFRLGLLVPLNRHVAVSLGIRPTFSILTGKVGGMIFQVPIGWLGLEAFI